jgi:two-component system, LytTR family, response regulator
MNAIQTSVIANLCHPLPEALLLPFQSGRRWVGLQQIIRLEGNGNYTTLFFTDGSHLMVALTLKRLLKRIPDGTFVRPHRKHLINRAFIVGVHASTFTIDLSNGDSVCIARRRASAFRQDIQPAVA